ncbi:MAG: ComF family protein [Vulcanococcus sp.]
MLPLLWREALALISAARCPACGGVAAEPSVSRAALLCADCQQALNLPEGGLQGDAPLLWCALGAYGSGLRRVLLRQRPRPQPALIQALAAQLHSLCSTALPGALLVPIPSWKRASNPLPRLLAAGLVQSAGGRCRLAEGLLQRSRPTVGQHHLNRPQRLGNQRGSFRCTTAGRAPLWLVDDILTTGATAQAAAEVLEARGWAVQGLLCLGRTPGPGTAVI